MERRLKLRVGDVLNKWFNIDFKGYPSVEVGEFLDLVINDYREYDAMIKNLGERLQEYEKQTVAMEAKIIELERKQGAVQKESVAANGNVDILKRLARLENAVFASKKQTASSTAVTGRKVRGKSVLTHSVMDVVSVLDETINSGSVS